MNNTSIQICIIHIISILHARRRLLCGFKVWKKTPKSNNFTTCSTPRASHRHPVNPNSNPSSNRGPGLAAHTLERALHLLLEGVAVGAAIDEMVAAQNNPPCLQIFAIATPKAQAVFSLEKDFILFLGWRRDHWADFVLPQHHVWLWEKQ